MQEYAGEGNTQPLVTKYRYDPLGQITQVIDAAGNTTRAEYDNLGRRTALDNPDAGLTETRYDLAGNAIEKITARLRANSRAIAYSYDYNRLAAISYPSMPADNVAYQYGGPGASYNQAGRIVQVSSRAGSEERRYDPLGQIVYEKKSVITRQTPQRPEVYETKSAFDSWGRVLTLTYPDGEVLTHRYDSGGNLSSISGTVPRAPRSTSSAWNTTTTSSACTSCWPTASPPAGVTTR